MAPAILKTTSTPLREAAGSSVETLRKIKKYIIANTEDVGADFAREARKIHEGEVAERPIRGQATDAEAQSLTEDGIAFGVLPPLPEDHN